MAGLLAAATTLLPMANSLINTLMPTAEKAFSGAKKGFCNCEPEKQRAIDQKESDACQKNISFKETLENSFDGEEVTDNEQFDEWLFRKFPNLLTSEDRWGGEIQEILISKGINIKKEFKNWYEEYYNEKVEDYEEEEEPKYEQEEPKYEVLEHRPVIAPAVKHDLFQKPSVVTALKQEYKPRTMRHLKKRKNKRNRY